MPVAGYQKGKRDESQFMATSQKEEEDDSSQFAAFSNTAPVDSLSKRLRPLSDVPFKKKIFKIRSKPQAKDGKDYIHEVTGYLLEKYNTAMSEDLTGLENNLQVPLREGSPEKPSGGDDI